MSRRALITLLFVAVIAPAARAADAAKPSTYAQVHAIFAKHCLSCHDAKEADGELVLASHESLLKGGDTGKAIVPGKSGESLLVKLIERTEKPFMPPPKKGEKLSDAEIGMIRAWIDAGALPGEAGQPLPATPFVLPKIAPRPGAMNQSSVNALGVDSAGKLYAVGLPGVVELRSLETRIVGRKLGGHRGNVNDVAFSADGLTLAAAAGEPGVAGEVKVWNVAEGTLIRPITGHLDTIYAVAISPDGKTLATGSYDQQIKLWDLATGNELRTLKGHNGCVFDLAFRNDGKVLASASADRTVKLWDVATGTRLDTFSESLKELYAVAFAPDGLRVFAAGVDNRIRVWAVSAEAKEGTNKLLQSVFAHEGAVLRLAFSPDGKTLASSAEDGTVKLWNAGDVTIRHALPKQPDWPTALALTNASLLVGRLDGSLETYEVASGKVAPPPPKPEISAAEPRGVRRGGTTKIKLTGKHLAGVAAASSPEKSLKLEIAPGASAETIWLNVEAPGTVTAGDVSVSVTGPTGESNAVKLFVDPFPQSAEAEPNDEVSTATQLSTLPATAWGTLATPGDADHFAFDAKAGQSLVIDVAGRRVGGKLDAVLTLLDAAGNVIATNNDADGSPDPLLAFTPPVDGRYVVRISDLQVGASPEHFYRVTVGNFPLVTGVFPSGVPANTESTVQLLGYNLPAAASATVKTGPDGETNVPLDPNVYYRVRREPKVLVNTTAAVVEAEPNDQPAQATSLPAPGIADGRLMSAPDRAGESDADLFRFDAKKGQPWIVETFAARRGSPADTKIEILDASGNAVPRVLLRAVRDSYLEFRPVGPNDIGGRLKSWEEMELNEYLYMNGEVVKLFLYPRGPDSQWDFYALNGVRRCYFDTSAATHALDEPCYIVEPLPPLSKPAPNGLPLFPLNYANDDDAERKLGADSRLTFTAPADGAYLVRVTDTRGGAGSDRHAYRLAVREAKPDFAVTLAPDATAIPPGSGVGFTVRAERVDNFDHDIRVDVTGLPPGFTASTPIVIQAGHVEARGTLWANADAPQTTDANSMAAKVSAGATVSGKSIAKDVNGFGKLTLGGKAPVVVSLDVTENAKPRSDSDATPELTIAPGQTISAWLSCARDSHKGLVTFEVQNLPHGVIVADIGLNGVLIPKGETRRQIFLTCAPWVPGHDRLAFARAREGGTPTSKPVLIRVRKPSQNAATP